MRRLAIAALLVAGLGSLALWRWTRPPRERALPANWNAVAVIVAGDGVAAARDGDPTRARFSDPFGVAVASDGSIYVADAGDAQAVRRIAPDGIVSTLAGGVSGYADGSGGAAQFNSPSGMAIDAQGNIFVADTANNAVRRVSRQGDVSTIAGGLSAGYLDEVREQARFNGPVGIAVDGRGRVIVADTYNDRIRAIELDGRVTTIAGGGEPGFVDGAAAEARFDTPCGVAVDRAGTIYVADTGNSAVRMISRSGEVTTIGPLPVEGLLHPMGIAATAGGTLYVTDDRGLIVEIVPGARARTLAGSTPGFANGYGADARFRGLAAVAVAAPGRLVATDPRNALVRAVADPSRIDLRPASPPRVVPRFDVDAFAREPLLWPLAPMEGPFELTGTLGEARGGPTGERFHAGIDVHGAEGTPVLAVRPGVVAGPLSTGEFGSLSESVRIGPIAYIHLRVGRDRQNQAIDTSRFVPTYDETGRMTRIRVKRGARFSSGDVVGTVNAFNHVHLNVGWPGEEFNPLQFGLLQFEDSIPPTISSGGILLFRPDGERIKERKKGRLIVDSPVHIVVDAWDQANGNERRRRLGLYRLGFQVLDRSGNPAAGFETPHETIRFDRLAGDPDAPRVIYAPGSGIPFYGGRRTRFLYNVTNTLAGGIVSTGVWDATTLPPGDYVLRILAADINGNEAVRNRDLPITIVSPQR